MNPDLSLAARLGEQLAIALLGEYTAEDYDYDAPFEPLRDLEQRLLQHEQEVPFAVTQVLAHYRSRQG